MDDLVAAEMTGGEGGAAASGTPAQMASGATAYASSSSSSAAAGGAGAGAGGGAYNHHHNVSTAAAGKHNAHQPSAGRGKGLEEEVEHLLNLVNDFPSPVAKTTTSLLVQSNYPPCIHYPL